MGGYPFGLAVTMLTRTKTGTDADGNDILTDTSTLITGCAFDPGGSYEHVQGQDLVVTTPTLYAPAGTVVDSYAAFIIGGHKYEVDGSPNDYTSPFTGWKPGIAIKLKRVTG